TGRGTLTSSPCGPFPRREGGRGLGRSYRRFRFEACPYRIAERLYLVQRDVQPTVRASPRTARYNLGRLHVARNTPSATGHQRRWSRGAPPASRSPRIRLARSERHPHPTKEYAMSPDPNSPTGPGSLQRNAFGARDTLKTRAGALAFYRLSALDGQTALPLDRLPVTVRILIENALRATDLEPGLVSEAEVAA